MKIIRKLIQLKEAGLKPGLNSQATSMIGGRVVKNEINQPINGWKVEVERLYNDRLYYCHYIRISITCPDGQVIELMESAEDSDEGILYETTKLFRQVASLFKLPTVFDGEFARKVIAAGGYYED